MSESGKFKQAEFATNYEILKKVCANTPKNAHILILQVLCKDSGDIVWAVGDDRVCAITHEDFVCNPDTSYADVLIQEFPYAEYTPQQTGKWSRVILELVRMTLDKYLEHDGLVHVYPWWLPDDMHTNLGKELLEQICADCDHIILRDDDTLEFVLKKS